MFNEKIKDYAKNVFLCGLIAILCGSVTAQKYVGSPVTKARALKVIASREYSLPEIVGTIQKYGVNFKMTSDVEAEFLAVKARPQIIEALKNNYRAAVVETATASKTGSTTANNRTNVSTTSQTSAQAAKDEKYDELYYKGLQLISQMRTATNQQQANGIANQIIEIGYQAIEVDKSRPEAYKIVGSGLMFNGQFQMALEFGQKAIDLGSSLAFPVYHLSGTPHPEVLYVGKNYITIESNQKYFQYSTSEIMEVSPQGYYNIPNGSVAVLGIGTMKDGRADAWYFTPATSGTMQEVEMIIRLIKKNASGGR